MTIVSDKVKYTSFTSIMASTPMKNHQAMVFDSNDKEEKIQDISELTTDTQQEMIKEDVDNPYYEKVKQIESLISSVQLHSSETNSDDDDDSLSNEISHLTDAEVELRKELNDVGLKYGKENQYDTSTHVPLICSNKSLVDDIESDESEYDEYDLTLEEKVGWDDDFEQVRSPTSGYIQTYEKWQDQIEYYSYDAFYPTINLPNSILSNQQDQRCVVENTTILQKCQREYIVPPPYHHLESMFIGIRPLSLQNIPVVRIAYIQIRPDVRCGSVMDALAFCITCLNAVIRKRQGGHFIAYIPAVTHGDVNYGAIHMEAQLVTRRKNTSLCERVLLLQFFSHDDKNDSFEDDLLVNDSISSTEDINELYYKEEDVLSELARLWQYNPNTIPNTIPCSTLDNEIMNYFLTSSMKTKSTYYIPSTLDHMTPYLNTSWIILTKTIDQLETRYLSYNTILKSPLCSFLKLDYLFDAQYLSHLQSYCHDIMVQSIIKVSDDIESYAREEEQKSNLILNVLLDTFELYDMEFPENKCSMLPLSAYPLNYTAPEISCPPWGAKVKMALNTISEMSNKQTALSYTDTEELIHAFGKTESAVKLLLSAFAKQYEDEEQATISRKNIYVMNRINKLQIFKRDCILGLHHAYGSYEWATKASDEFFSNAVSAIHYPITISNTIEAPQVPLFKCPIVLETEGVAYKSNEIPSSVSSCTTICYISLQYVLINITTAPILLSIFTKPTCLLFELKSCKVEYNEDKVCVICSYKDENYVTMEEDVIVAFRPCIGGYGDKEYSSARLVVDFCNLVKNINVQ